MLRSPSIRHIQAERRRRAIAWSDRLVLFVTTRATVQGRVGVGLRRDAPAFPGGRGRFTCLTDKRAGPAPPDGSLDLPSLARFQPVSARSDGFAPDIMAPYTHYPPLNPSGISRGILIQRFAPDGIS